jgi:hypothetical protein
MNNIFYDRGFIFIKTEENKYFYVSFHSTIDSSASPDKIVLLQQANIRSGCLCKSDFVIPLCGMIVPACGMIVPWSGMIIPWAGITNKSFTYLY